MTVPNDQHASIPVTDLRAFFEGRWEIVRRIDDRRAGTQHVMQGSGCFQPAASAPATLVYDEAVVWQPAGQTMTGTRRYLIADIAGAAARVLFDDGRLFHALDLSAGACPVHHHCPPDLYAGSYRVLDRNRFIVRWAVTGPRKDSVLVTTFTRMS
jgi:hypothetical protein